MFNFNLNPILNYRNFNCVLETVKNRFNTYKLSSWQDYKQFSIDIISYPFRTHVEQSKSLSKERIKAIKINNNGKNELSLKPSHSEKKAINNKDTLIENSEKRTDHRSNIKKIALLASGAIAAAALGIYLYNKIYNEFDESPTTFPAEFKPSMDTVTPIANALITYPKEIFPNYIDFSAPFTKPNLNQYYFNQLNSNIENDSDNSINSNMGIFSLAINVGIPALAAIVGLKSFWNLVEKNNDLKPILPARKPSDKPKISKIFNVQNKVKVDQAKALKTNNSSFGPKEDELNNRINAEPSDKPKIAKAFNNKNKFKVDQATALKTNNSSSRSKKKDLNNIISRVSIAQAKINDNTKFTPLNIQDSEIPEIETEGTANQTISSQTNNFSLFPRNSNELANSTNLATSIPAEINSSVQFPSLSGQDPENEDILIETASSNSEIVNPSHSLIPNLEINSNSITKKELKIINSTNPVEEIKLVNADDSFITSETRSSEPLASSNFQDPPITESMIELGSSDLANFNSVAKSPVEAEINENLHAHLANRLKQIRTEKISEFGSEIETPEASPFSSGIESSPPIEEPEERTTKLPEAPLQKLDLNMGGVSFENFIQRKQAEDENHTNETKTKVRTLIEYGENRTVKKVLKVEEFTNLPIPDQDWK